MREGADGGHFLTLTSKDCTIGEGHCVLHRHMNPLSSCGHTCLRYRMEDSWVHFHVPPAQTVNVMTTEIHFCFLSYFIKSRKGELGMTLLWSSSEVLSKPF